MKSENDSQTPSRNPHLPECSSYLSNFVSDDRSHNRDRRLMAAIIVGGNPEDLDKLTDLIKEWQGIELLYKKIVRL